MSDLHCFEVWFDVNDYTAVFNPVLGDNFAESIVVGVFGGVIIQAAYFEADPGYAAFFQKIGDCRGPGGRKLPVAGKLLAGKFFITGMAFNTEIKSSVAF